MKKITTFLLMISICMLTACNGNNNGEIAPSDPGNEETNMSQTVVPKTISPEATVEGKELSAKELYEKINTKWRSGEFTNLYSYAGEQMKALMEEEDFISMFRTISRGQKLISLSNEKDSTANGISVYNATYEFEHMKADITISIQDGKLVGLNYKNVSFTEEWDETIEEQVTEHYFTMSNEKYQLNAAYTYINDGKKHPTVLLVAGSGPSDLDETVGLLSPFADLAEGLAKNGINSFRMDKRTYNYGASFDTKAGIEEEYLMDARKALEYLKEQESVGDIYLIGHSLGGQIVPILALEDEDVKGIVVLNSSGRNLAVIACDQYSNLDEKNQSTYEAYRDSALGATKENATGASYLGASDYYWASLNEVDVIANIKALKIPVLIMNSTNDAQIFDTDIELWKENFETSDYVTLYVDDKMSHFMYDIDVTDSKTLYHQVPLPERIVTMITEFCL